jgi:hypothetical protein
MNPSNKYSDLVVEMVRKEFEIVGGDFDKETKQERWFASRKFTPSQKKKWKDFCVKSMRTKLKWPKSIVEKEFAWLDLMYGFSEDRKDQNGQKKAKKDT